ncbi:hypothetical protein [Sporosarcina sp. G11-34]|uniref:hypothetical protein n=1 Tax=Sporosarcina sp. G11-34 TaxID=2849605 RepID=UPI0022A8F250|nr:hypothetical protein [Sporosarcina sp. G11-34]MCZ2260399.1 hypothetical protein [Sporosarcina sp. G11-34]
MARKKSNGLLLTTIAAGAYAYFSKKENRDKAQVAFNNMKIKVDSFIKTQQMNRSTEMKTGHPDPYDTQDSKMVSEGAQTSVQYYNEVVEDNVKVTSETDGLYNKKLTKENATE